MNKMLIIIILFFCICFSTCTKNRSTEKYQNNRSNFVNVKNKVVEIFFEEAIIGSIARLHLINDYLIIQDPKSDHMLIHLFSRNNYEYVTSTVPKGQGPGEVANMGHIGINEITQEFFVSDHGKLKIFSYSLDSILINPYYVPSLKKEINNVQFPSSYEFINDTLCFARIIEPSGNVGHNEAAAKWNMKTGEITKMKYSHPKTEKKRIDLAVSIDNEILVECYQNHDLMTIMDLDGNLKYNVYGSNWNSRNASQFRHFGKILFREDKIIASYSGGDLRSEEYYPDKLLIFNIRGDYIKTLDIGYRISDFCYDQNYDRIIFNFEDIIQFGFLEMNDLLD